MSDKTELQAEASATHSLSSTEGAMLERLVMRTFYGWYEETESKPMGLGRQREWKHNPNIELTRQQQIDINSESQADFCISKYIPPAVKVVFR